MPRSSRHKSHKQSKHSLKEVRDYSDSEVDDVKIKDSGSRSIFDRVLKDSGRLTSGEKRKMSLQVKEGGKELSGRRNGDASEEKAVEKSNGGDRSNDGEKGMKSREGKSRSGKRYESGGDVKEDSLVVLEKKEYNKSGGRGETRKSEKEKEGREIKELTVKEKDGNDIKDSREKERGFEKDKKGVESRRGKEVNAVGDVMRKQEMKMDDLVEDGGRKRSRNNADCPSRGETRNVEIDEKRSRKKKEYGDLDKLQDDIRDSEVSRLSSRSERVKEGRSFDEKIKEGNHGEKYYEDVDKDVKRHDDLDKDSKYRDDKYRDGGDRDSRHRDDKYRDDGDRDVRRREDKYRQESGRDAKRRDDQNRGEIERDGRRREDKYREDGETDNRRKDDKHREGADKETRLSDTRHYDEADKDGRHKVERFREDTDRDIKHKEDKHRDDYERENRHRDKLRVDVDRERRFREGKYRDDLLPKDCSSDKSGSKRSRDENYASGFHSRKSSLYDDGDDRMSRYKDDHAEKHSSGPGLGDLGHERGRPTSKIADMDLPTTQYRRQSSPSSGSHIMSNQYRLSKQDDPKYKDNGVTPNREHEKKLLPRDDTNSGELAAEQLRRSDTRASPRPLMDKSPSSMSEHRNSRTDLRRNLDVNESGRRHGGSRDGKGYLNREARGSRNVSMEMFPGDEFSEVDGDNNGSVLSSARGGHLSNSSKSLLAPPPFRAGVDSPSQFGMSNDDSRGKSSNRHRRLGDTTMGRMQSNSWRGVPNWPSPVANGFMPFQHGPPPVGFHPMMQQFPTPPLFGVRPSMDVNHQGLPYPIPDHDRFSGHVRPMGWRNLVDDACPPSLHGWEANNAIVNEDSHIFGRPDWDNSWNHPGVRTNNANTETAASEKQNGEADEPIVGQFNKQSQHVKTQHGFQADSSGETGPPTEAVESGTLEPSLKSKEILNAEEESEKDDGNLCRAYLSKLDISANLADPELYVQCANLYGVDHSLLFDGDGYKILYLEEAGDGKAASNEVPSTFLFTASDDRVFEKAMKLYKKNKEVFKITEPGTLSPSGLKNTGSSPFFTVENMSRKDVAVEEMAVAGGEQDQIVLRNDSKVKEPDFLENVGVPASQNRVLDNKMSRKDVAVEEMAVAGGEQAQIDLPNVIKAKEPDCFENMGVPASQNIDADNKMDESDSSVYATSNTSMEVQVSSDIDARDITDSLIEDNLGLETANSPAAAVESEITMTDATIAGDVPISSIEGERGMDVKCGTPLISDIPEAVMLESTESGSVNLSRIHHSPESTH